MVNLKFSHYKEFVEALFANETVKAFTNTLIGVPLTSNKDEGGTNVSGTNVSGGKKKKYRKIKKTKTRKSKKKKRNNTRYRVSP